MIPPLGGNYRATLEGNGLQLHLHMPQRPFRGFGDRTRLAQTVSNLMHNASKFTDPGAAVTVDLREDAANKDVIFVVRDTGIGMEPEVLARLFEPCSQGDHGMDRRRGGLGLGLALVKRLIELHGGDVRAPSDGLGRGSELTIRLPLQPEPAPATKAVVHRVRSARFYQVLVIEDNRLAVRTMKIFLIRQGHNVEVAYTGPEGSAAARRFQPDVVRCDIGLPGCDGYTVAQQLRQEAPVNRVYLIAVSGYGQERDKQRAWEAGCDAYLVKPINLQELETKLLEFSQAEQSSMKMGTI